MALPRIFTDLVNHLTLLPGVGEKTAERYVYSLCDKEPEEVENLANALIDFKKNIRYCEICGCLTDTDECDICSNSNRDRSTICIVEDSKNVFFIEKTKKYNGLYHVLNGVISPIEGKNPEDLNLYSLLNNRITNGIKEIIIATNPRVEGEATAMYLSKLIKPLGIRVTRIAHGIPVGGDLEYTDEITLTKALEGRREL